MAQRKRGPWVWLVVAALLLGGGAWLMRGAEPPERPARPQVRLPTKKTRSEHLLSDNRKTWLPAVVFDAGVALSKPTPPRDPVLALMPSEVKQVAMVAEFNAIVNSELGGLMTDCLFGDGEFLGELRDAGLDPINGIDRVAMIDESMVVTGDFKNAQWRRSSGTGGLQGLRAAGRADRAAARRRRRRDLRGVGRADVRRRW